MDCDVKVEVNMQKKYDMGQVPIHINNNENIELPTVANYHRLINVIFRLFT